MENIQFDGLNNLNAEEQRIAEKIASHHYPKIQRALKNITKLVVHVKTHKAHAPGQDAPKAKKFSVHVHVHAPTKTIRSSSAHDWHLEKSLHKAFKDVQREIEHAFKD